MAEYKKKKIKRSKKAPKNTYVEEIKMEPSKKKTVSNKKTQISTEKETPKKKKKPTSVKQSKINVIRGNKPLKRKRNAKIVAVIFLIVAFFALISILLPTGIIDAVSNSFALIGKGDGYDVKLGGNTLSNVVDMGNSYITVTTTDIRGYNHTGKSIFTYLHGYDIPIVKASASRFMLYGQGENQYGIYNLSNKLFEGEAANEILAGYISRSGTFAIATLSDSYTSEVSVYNKNNEIIYTWYCADYIINDVLLDNDGDTLVLSAFNAVNGKFVSKIYVIKFNSATPIRIFDYNDLILSLSSKNSAYFSAIFEKNVEYFNWRNFALQSYSFENNVSYFDSTANHNVIVTARNANKGDNTITVFNGRGKQKHQFSFDTEILDISVRGRYIYILSNNEVSIYNYQGGRIKSSPTNFGANYIVSIGNLKAAVFSDNFIKRVVAQ